MLKRPTLSERHQPIGATDVINAWNDTLINHLLKCVWSAYDTLRSEFLWQVDFSQSSDDLERELTKKLFLQIQRRFDFNLPVQPIHESPEHESRPNPSGRPPAYDIAFVLNSNDRICWPLEAKVLESDEDTVANLGRYLRDFNEEFMPCRYAPFSTSASMFGYLKSGDPNTVLDHIAQRLSCTMTPHADFPTRVHRTSDHIRPVPPERPCPTAFRCHHLIMPLN